MIGRASDAAKRPAAQPGGGRLDAHAGRQLWLGEMLLRTVAATLLLALPAPVLAQDFDPRGRHHRPAPQHAATGGAIGQGGSAPPAPSQAALIARYTQVVLTQPGAVFPLQRLAQLYRERDGNVSRLIADFEARAAKPDAGAYAATVALGGLYKLDARIEEAIAAYEKAALLKQDDPSATLALAHLLEDRGDLAAARTRYEQALALQTLRADREQTLRTLMALALTAQDWMAAKEFHTRLVQLEPTSLFVRGELGRELFARGEYARAASELQAVAAAAAGDNRALAPALKELGRAQAKAHENEAALVTLKRALAAAGGETALRAEIYQTIAEIYRSDQRLPALVEELENEHPRDAPRLALLGSLYDETGDSAKAIDTYRRSLASDPRQLDLRLRMIRLLQSNGELDRAIAEYDTLIQAAPNNPQFVFEDCDALLQRGDRARALRLLTELEARASTDDEVLSRVAEYYGRIGEGERSLRVLRKLASTSGASDPGPLVDLGDRYFQDGNTQLAVQTWKRILAVVTPRARALAALGDVYLEHDMGADAVAAYKEAIQLDPAGLGTKKALAAAFERTHAYREARLLYEDIVAKARQAGDKALARECRTRIVTLWGLERVLEQQLPGLRARFGGTPPDSEAGRMLAEALAHLRRLPEAQAALERVVDLEPGDAETYLALERVLVQETKIAEAIDVLTRLAKLDPNRARELYQRMAQYALQIYRDDDAIQFAARAVELNPDDAEGHRRLAEMYRSKQDTDRAIAEFRSAIAKNDRLFVVYFELADLLLSKGRAEEADRLFRGVVRGAPDEDLVARAARLSMQINLGKGTLESLEQDLLPLAIGNPQRRVYRRLLVEVYGSLTFGLVQRVRHGTREEADGARAALARIGARAIKPLLDALADTDVTQQRIAIDVLAYVQNRNAALPLFAFATGAADVTLRTRAMQACGALADGSLVGKYEALLYPKDAALDQAPLADSVGVAAVWGLARIDDARSLPVLRRIAVTASPAMRALAVLGLGMARDAGSVAEIADVARSVDAGAIARAAAAYALGLMDAQSQVPALIDMAEDGEALPRRMALLSLARMAAASPKDPAWKGRAVEAMADAVFAGGGEDSGARKSAEGVSRAAVAALAAVATRGQAGQGWARTKETMPLPEGAFDVEALFDRLGPTETLDSERAAALVAHSEAIERSALSALRTSGPRAAAVLDALGAGDGELLPFVGYGATGPAAEVARRISAALEPSLVPLAKHPDPTIREKALVLVARSSSDEAIDAVARAVQDPSEAVQRVALAAVCAPRADGAHPVAGEAEAAAVAKILTSHESWAMRVLAARALGRMGAAGFAGATAPLAASASADSYALVRQSALEALSSFDPQAAGPIARRMATSDPEPRVREVARTLER